MQVTVIIATCGRPDRLARCRDAVQVAMRNYGSRAAAPPYGIMRIPDVDDGCVVVLALQHEND